LCSRRAGSWPLHPNPNESWGFKLRHAAAAATIRWNLPAFQLYARLTEGLAEHADEIVGLCLRIVS
jgi:hypothetical protein